MKNRFTNMVVDEWYKLSQHVVGNDENWFTDKVLDKWYKPVAAPGNFRWRG